MKRMSNERNYPREPGKVKAGIGNFVNMPFENDF
jgi:hypothetical protein